MKVLMITNHQGEVFFPGETGILNIETKQDANKVKNAMEKQETLLVIDPRLSEKKGILIEPEQIIEIENKGFRLIFTVQSFAKRKANKESSQEVAAAIKEDTHSDKAVFVDADPYNYTISDNAELLVIIKHIKEKFTTFESNLSLRATTLPANPIKCLLAITKEIIKHDKFKADELYLIDDFNELALELEIYLSGHLEIMEIDERVNDKVKEAMELNQKEYYIREQIKALKDEIGEGDESDKYSLGVQKLKAPENIKSKLLEDVRKLDKMAESSPDSAQLRNYLDFALSLPWSKVNKENVDLIRAEKILEADHYGIKEVKDRLIEALAVRKLTKGAKSPIICLVGAPGIGKTSIAKSIARAMNRSYERISLGGINDESEIRGHRKTYVGAMSGRILNAIKASGTSNPLLLLDELDKMSSTYKGDPSSAMLEVLDPEQNINFRDHYLEVPFDLSKVLFIATANTLSTVPRPLLDRMEIIEMSGYTDIEKLEIAKRYLIKKAINECGIKENGIKVKIDDSAIMDIIHLYTRESGVRGLEKAINKIMRKLAKRFCIEGFQTAKITSKNLTEYLEEPKFPETILNKNDKVGVVNGLAWTEVGGEMLSIEVNTMKGKGEMIITGNLGDVMKESCRIAFSYIKSISEKMGIDSKFFQENDIHIHVPEGATPKDGPSAGITILTALYSALTNEAVPYAIAMTGELSLKGNVLPIGGLKEKSLAALRNGIKKIFISEQNVLDYKKLPEEVKNAIEFKQVGDVDQILEEIFDYGN